MTLRSQTLNRGNIATPICQYWPLAAEVGFTRAVGKCPLWWSRPRVKVVVAPLMITAVLSATTALRSGLQGGKLKQSNSNNL